MVSRLAAVPVDMTGPLRGGGGLLPVQLAVAGKEAGHLGKAMALPGLNGPSV